MSNLMQSLTGQSTQSCSSQDAIKNAYVLAVGGKTVASDIPFGLKMKMDEKGVKI